MSGMVMATATRRIVAGRSVLWSAVLLEVLPTLEGHEHEPGDVEGDEERSAHREEVNGDRAADDDGDPCGDDERGALAQKHPEEVPRGVTAVEGRGWDEVEQAPADVRVEQRRQQGSE